MGVQTGTRPAPMGGTATLTTVVIAALAAIAANRPARGFPQVAATLPR